MIIDFSLSFFFLAFFSLSSIQFLYLAPEEIKNVLFE